MYAHSHMHGLDWQSVDHLPLLRLCSPFEFNQTYQTPLPFITLNLKPLITA